MTWVIEAERPQCTGHLMLPSSVESGEERRVDQHGNLPFLVSLHNLEWHDRGAAAVGHGYYVFLTWKGDVKQGPQLFE